MVTPTDSTMIDTAERELGRTLPPVLRERLTANNGGEVRADGDDWRLHPVWDPTDRRTMRRTANHLVAETMTARNWPRFPAEAIAVASNGTGDLLVVLPDENVVKLWRHDTGEIVSEIDIHWE